MYGTVDIGYLHCQISADASAAFDLLYGVNFFVQSVPCYIFIIIFFCKRNGFIIVTL